MNTLCCRATLGILFLLCTRAYAGDDELDRGTLRGLSGVAVSIVPLKETTVNVALEEEQLKTDVELKLRKAGIRVLTPSEVRHAAGGPVLSIRVTCSGGGTHEFYYGFAELSLHQSVVLERDPKIGTYLETWSVSGGLGQAPKASIERLIRDKLSDQVDKFINAYLAVNQRGTQPSR